MAQSKKPGALTWGECELSAGERKAFRRGPLLLLLERREGEWRIAWRYDAPGGAQADPDAVGDDDWVRFATEDEGAVLHVGPCLPDLPVVARPAGAFEVLGEQSARIYVSVPLWVRLTLQGDRNVVLAEVPTVVLTRTWFGTTVRGELCYGLRTRARREAEPAADPMAGAPVLMQNRMPSSLPVKKICLRVPHLALYGTDDDAIWTEETRLSVRHPGEETVEYGGAPPPEAPGSAELAPRRCDPKRSFLASMLNF